MEALRQPQKCTHKWGEKIFLFRHVLLLELYQVFFFPGNIFLIMAGGWMARAEISTVFLTLARLWIYQENQKAFFKQTDLHEHNLFNHDRRIKIHYFFGVNY
jgi:hypothetical protein